MGVIRPPHQVCGMVPRLRIELNNFSYTGINVSRLAFIISFLILSENGEILFFNFSAAWGISLLVIMKFKGRECWPWPSFSRSSLQFYCWAGLRGSFEWRLWKYCSQFSSEIDGTSSSFLVSSIDLRHCQKVFASGLSTVFSSSEILAL